MCAKSLYDPGASWRAEPATDAQRKLLADMQIAAPEIATKGDLSDLISKNQEPNEDEVTFLKFFGVKLPKAATQFDAGKQIFEILSDPTNMAKWDARLATKRQKNIILIVEGKVPQGLTLIAADKLIKAYWNDAKKNANYEAAIDALDQRQAADDDKEDRAYSIKHHCDYINSQPANFGLKRVSLKAVTHAVGVLEQRNGEPLEKLEDDTWFWERIADEIRKVDPSKATSEALRRPAFFRPWEAIPTNTNKVQPSRGNKSWFRALLGLVSKRTRPGQGGPDS
jgi:hypothetical protein